MDERGQARQIVVATDHLRLVGTELDKYLAADTPMNVGLGLTLLTLRGDLGDIGRLLSAQRESEFGPGAAPEVRTGRDQDLDRILAELRCLYALRHAGWIPTLGKNRMVTGVAFTPYTRGFDVPAPARAPDPVPHTATTDTGVRVGLYDTRIAPHSHLAGHYLAGPDARLVPGARAERMWWEGHATFVAGLIVRHAPSAELDVRTALRSGAPEEPYGPAAEWTVPSWTVAERLAELRDAGVSVINLSVGVATADGRPPLLLERAVSQLSADVAVVAAAGDHGAGDLSAEQRDELGMPARDAAVFPAALDHVLAVGALDGRGRPAAFNPCGAGGTGVAPWVDVFADGVGVVSTYLGDANGEEVLIVHPDGRRESTLFTGWASWTGTSCATGEITGVVAALLAEGYTPPEAVAEVRARYPRP